MGTLTLENFRTAVRFAVDNRDDLSDSNVDRWINATYRHISMPGIYRHRELLDEQNITLVTDTESYTLDADVGYVHSVHNTTQRFKLMPDEIRNFWRSTNPSSQPRTYYVLRNTIFFKGNPTGDDNGQNIRVYFWKRPDILVAGQATTIRDEWDDVIVVGATWRAWRDLGRPDREEITRQNYGRLINDVTPVNIVEGEDDGWQIEPEIQRYQEQR